MNTAAEIQPSRWKIALTMIMNPGEVIKKQMNRVPWPFSLFISGLAFTLFFLQTGLDMYRNAQIGTSTVILITILGIIYGTAGISAVAALAWVLCSSKENEYSLDWTISSFALGYSATLVYVLTGLIFSVLFGWKTSVAFGVTGLLWALRPTIVTIRQMSGDRVSFSVTVATLCGAILLFGWALLGRFGL